MLGIYCRTSVETDGTSIEQQKKDGIKFSLSHNFKYQIYIDEGISGYKVDSKNLFKDLKELKKLVDDIEDKIIDKVWVWEHSRLSRNEELSFYLKRLFKKHNITVYEKDKLFDFNDPQTQFLSQILDAVSQLERHQIVSRTTRGLRKRIDDGKRVHQKLYCYRKEGKDENGYVKWVPVESEIENYKHILKMFKKGDTLRKITFDIYDKKREKWGIPSYSHFLGRILRGYQYTGYQLTIEGNEIYKKFRKNEIDNIQILLDRKYWIKSIPYPVKLISIEDWVSVCEKLQIRGSKLNKIKKDRLLRASKDICTGIITCCDCNSRFYYKEQRITNNKGRNWIYTTYFHHQYFNNKVCSQRPKSFYVEYINEIFKSFFFYFKLVFDNKNEQMKESQRIIKLQQIKLKEEINKHETENRKISKQIDRFENIYMNSEDEEFIKLTLEKEKDLKSKRNKTIDIINNFKIENEKLSEKFNQNLIDITYYDVVDKVNEWFFKLNVEEQRTELIKTIKTCKVFSHYILIDAGTVVFLFDINQHYVFDMSLLENLNKKEVYKKYFIEEEGKKEVRIFNDKLISNFVLDKKTNIGKTNRELVDKYLKKELKITYDISEHTNLISFLSLQGIYNK